jgi:predicted negative regulator of RcsB-dependent stress response
MDSKPFYQSKIFWFNALFVIVALAGYFGFTDYQPDANTSELAAVLISVINLFLRFITKSPIK